MNISQPELEEVLELLILIILFIMNLNLDLEVMEMEWDYQLMLKLVTGEVEDKLAPQMKRELMR
jgi:hypothetical protein